MTPTSPAAPSPAPGSRSSPRRPSRQHGPSHPQNPMRANSPRRPTPARVLALVVRLALVVPLTLAASPAILVPLSHPALAAPAGTHSSSSTSSAAARPDPSIAVPSGAVPSGASPSITALSGPDLSGPDPWQPPLATPVTVLRAFDRPEETWLAGHRGVDLAAAVGDPVLAPRSGTVTFAAVVVDRPVLVIRHDDGLRTSLEPVLPDVAVGTRVVAGEQVGTVAAGGHSASTDSTDRESAGSEQSTGSGSTDAANGTGGADEAGGSGGPGDATGASVRGGLHWGVRDGTTYLDPMALLYPGPVVLLSAGTARTTPAGLDRSAAPDGRRPAPDAQRPTAGLQRSAAVGLGEPRPQPEHGRGVHLRDA